MANAAQKIFNRMNEEFADSLNKAFQNKFSLIVGTRYNVIDMRLVTVRRDEKPLTEEQVEFIDTYSSGYRDAMEQIGVTA